MKKVIIAFILLALIGALLILSGCGKVNTIDKPGYTTGGRTDNSDPKAPKTIESHELISFETGFFRYGDYVYDKERSYRFKLATDPNGAFFISEGYEENLSCETDPDFAAALDKLIRDYDLIKLNGKDSKTSGLPPEFDPYWIRAQYVSGEKLYFSMDGDPDSDWTRAILDLFAKEFGRHGINDLLPPKENSEMTRFSLEYSLGDNLSHRYSQILVPITEAEKERTLEDLVTNGANEDECELMVYSSHWDRVNRQALEKDRRAYPSPEYYEGLQEIVEETELIAVQNGTIIPPDFDYDGTTEFYEFYIEYASGKIMSGFSDDSDDCEKFRPIAEAFSEYVETYLDENLASEK